MRIDTSRHRLRWWWGPMGPRLLMPHLEIPIVDLEIAEHALLAVPIRRSFAPTICVLAATARSTE
ncbi:hypothetical protein [Nocardia vinacea]|uniref:hypothetical protein n=1 Tax=Nocardia vinacea TaxID=96468 RepID=UPI00030BE3B4|nr:hypothetical protein [Nocardia vinacea]